MLTLLESLWSVRNRTYFLWGQRRDSISLCIPCPHPHIQSLAQTLNHSMYSRSLFWINVPQLHQGRPLFFIIMTLSNRAYVRTRNPLYRKLEVPPSEFYSQFCLMSKWVREASGISHLSSNPRYTILGKLPNVSLCSFLYLFNADNSISDTSWASYEK